MYGDPDDGCPDCGTVSRIHDIGCEYINRDEPCPWCLDEHDDQWSDKLCRAHEAEYEGVTENQLDRRDAEQDAEYHEWVSFHDHATGDDAMFRFTYPTGGTWTD